jgi:hypothetical protein
MVVPELRRDWRFDMSNSMDATEAVHRVMHDWLNGEGD